MAKAIALSLSYPQNPLAAAFQSAGNFAKLAADFMYGTPKRVNITMGFFMAFIVLSSVMNMVNQTLLQTCPV